MDKMFQKIGWGQGVDPKTVVICILHFKWFLISLYTEEIETGYSGRYIMSVVYGKEESEFLAEDLYSKKLLWSYVKSW